MIDYSSFTKLSYGLYIIATEHDGEKAGYAGNTGFQVTAQPETIAVSCNKDNYTTEFIQKSKKFSLSVLQKDLDVAIVGDFGFKSGHDIDKFKHYDYKSGELGIPIVTESCVAAFECMVFSEVDCGTHILFIGKVVSAEKLSDNDPLTYAYYHEHYKMRSPKNAPTYIPPEKLEEENDDESKHNREHDKKSEQTTGAPPSDYVCIICGYTYDPEVGEPSMDIPPGTPFEDLPEDFLCPICNATKEFFKEV
ncbi:MAG: flavin reductase [Prolixibacteraceae bacterium]|jgi:flavin reductase (DIM6/NTAB) family NADH-FMN oxidoreductase RutF/rubredoxin|nr:flavin reductase [Prolixibacteraceae bacterium]